jgi:hypothetical protein
MRTFDGEERWESLRGPSHLINRSLANFPDAAGFWAAEEGSRPKSMRGGSIFKKA